MSYTIGEVDEMMGVTPSTLRYYDQEGLLPKINRIGKQGDVSLKKRANIIKEYIN